MGFINRTTLPSGNTYNLEGTLLAITGTQSSATNAWVGGSSNAPTQIEELKAGLTIAYYLPKDSTANNVTLNLYLADGTTTGAKDVYFGTERMQQQYKEGSIILLNYDGTKWRSNTYTDEGKTYTFTSGSGSAASFQVTEGGGSAQTIKVADVSTTVTANEDKLITSGAVAAALALLPTPMVFKGTLGTGGTYTNLPTATSSTVGWTLKVIEDGTYGGTAAIVGDLFICNDTPAWVRVPSGDDPGTVDTWRAIKVNGTEKLGNSVTTGNVDFVNGTNTSVSFNTSGNKISIDVPETKKYLTASASGTAVTAPTSAAVTSYPGATSKLATTSIPNVTSAGTAASWSATVSNETLAFSWTANNPATLGTAITAATGSLSATGSGDSVMTGLGTPQTSNFVTGVSVSANPTITLSSSGTTSTGAVEYVEDIGPTS